MAAALKQRASDTGVEDLRREAVLDTARSGGAGPGAGDPLHAITSESRRTGGGPLSLRQFERAEGWTLAAEARGVVPVKSSIAARQQQSSRHQVAEAGETLFGSPRAVPALELRRLLRHGGDGGDSSGDDVDSVVDVEVDVGGADDPARAALGAGSGAGGNARGKPHHSTPHSRSANDEAPSSPPGTVGERSATPETSTDAAAEAELVLDLVGAVVMGDDLLGRNARGARYKRELQRKMPDSEALASYFADWDRSKAVWNKREEALRRARADRLKLEAAWQQRERDAKEAYATLYGAAVDIAAAQVAELRAKAGPDPETSGATAAWMHLRLGGFKPWSRNLSPRASGVDVKSASAASAGPSSPGLANGQWWGSSSSLYTDARERGGTPTSRDQQARDGAEAAVLRATGAAVAGGSVARALKHYPELQVLLMPSRSAASRQSSAAVTTAAQPEAGGADASATPTDSKGGEEEPTAVPAAPGSASAAAGQTSVAGHRAQAIAAVRGSLGPAPLMVEDDSAAVGRGPLVSVDTGSSAHASLPSASRDASLRKRLQLAKAALRLAVDGVDDVTPLASEAASAIAAGHWSYVAGFDPLPEEADAIERVDRARRRAERLGRDPPAAAKWQGQALPPGLTFEALSASMPLVAGKSRTRDPPSAVGAQAAPRRGSNRLKAGAKLLLEHRD